MYFLHGVTVTVRAPVNADPDPYGDTDPDAPTDSDWGPCAIAPRTSDERADSRSPGVITGLTIYGPPRTIAPNSQIVIASGTYAGTWEVEGIPGDWQSPFTGWHPGLEVPVTRASSQVPA